MRLSAAFSAAAGVCAALGLAALAPAPAHAVGFLVPTRADLEPLMIRNHRVTVTVRERSAETRVDQTFTNNTDQVLEATYVFPIPAGATVSGFAMWVNGRRQQGELLDAGRARTVYEGIVARMRDPGLVEMMGGNLFRARVYPIQPRSDQRIEVTFTELLDYEGGVVHYRYPLRTTGRAASTLEAFSIRADIVSRTPIRAVYSPTHTIDVSRPDDHHATVGFEAHATALENDFDLYYGVQDRDVGLSLLTHRLGADDGYFLAMIAPRADVTEREIAAKEVLFVIDTSGSMAGDKIARARTALDYMVQRLRPTDRFQVVRFSTDVETLFEGGTSVEATPANVERARRFVRGFVAAGGTAIDDALGTAMRLRAPAPALPRMVVFLTDGMPTIGETSPERIVSTVERIAGNARTFVFGVGDDVNTTFLDSLASRTRGVGDYFRDGLEMERRLSAFFDRVAYPLLTDLALHIPGASVHDVYPRDLGHLYRGGQLLVVGRYRGDGAARVELSAHVSGEQAERSFAFDVAFPQAQEQNAFLPRLWATRKIGYLLDEIRLRGERAELRDEVVVLARRFGIVTPYTSYLVAEDELVAPEGVAVAPIARGGDMRFEAPPPVVVAGQQGQAARMPARDPAPAAPAPAAADFAGFRSSTVTSYDFEDDGVDGSLQRPGGEAMAVRGRGGSSGGGGGVSLGNRGGSLGGGRPAGVTAPRTSPPPPPMLAPSGGMGESGRRVSQRLRTMREAERVGDSSSTASRFALGRSFRDAGGGVWVDSRYRRGMRELRLVWGSPAYFALVRARPDLAPALALGERVTITLDQDRAIVVDPGASIEMTAERVTQFLAH